MEKATYSAGTVLFHEGDDGSTAYLVASGVVEISRGEGSERKVLGEISAGGLFGEMALISNMPRMATATAKEDTACVIVPRQVLRSMLRDADALMTALVLNLIGHIRTLNETLSPPELKKRDVEFFFRDHDGVYQRRD